VQPFLAGGSERQEWFIRGTEPIAASLQVANLLPHIVYPPSGAVFALDADIPKNQQRIFFTASGRMNGLRWVLDGRSFRTVDGNASWSPSSGQHELALCNAGGQTLDSVRFQVRGRNRSGE
jgi:penicillin-binding protein 1C